MLLLTLRRPPRSPLFPYTTLFRSVPDLAFGIAVAAEEDAARRASADEHERGLGLRKAGEVIEVAVVAVGIVAVAVAQVRSEEHTSELQSRRDLVCRLLLEKKKPVA